ncbi:phytanoyl-CoA dioxygenase family protein [Paenibacillus psychroresistens]|uniref:Phytanoyl-CoA dioxygenase family protein n=1 Tax=Paenibacillus psychroresistens TaxID=1778678 RepID=A0A6B8RNK3_9BACL|nr:phytanoyl-CoA dioxygenase family protein [Paenibacillus psychroresistens]QGQ97292.1 phytanoyl-CoA dioxygenase family protein [Paenibacillus psychroresistens]
MTIESAKKIEITEQEMKQYKELGYIIFNNLFSAEEMDKVRAIIDEFDRESEMILRQKDRDFISSAGQINFTSGLNFRSPELQQFTADQRFVDITTTILGPDIKLYWDQSVYKRPEASKDFPWHQDNGYVPTEPEQYVTCWIALDDATVENGCIWVQPGTHLKGFVTHIKTDLGWICYYGDIEGIPVELKKGSVVAFNSLLFHKSTPNRSKTDTRKAYITQYSVDGSFNPITNKIFQNGPLIAKDGKSAYTEFVTKENC